MAGIYIHIPFCKQACHYCNFHFSLSLQRKNELIEAILLEIEQRKDYLNDLEIETIYFGGGTPSLLEYDDLSRIKEKIDSSFKNIQLQEFTLEANPDDITQNKIKDFIKIGINRLSIGIQSFRDDDLQYMHRAHNAQEALSSIYRSQDAGIDNLSIDLIYGTPTMDMNQWQNNLQIAIDTKVPHISSYALTIEPKTKLDSLIKKKLKIHPKEDQVANQFIELIHTLELNQFEQYEISNFCKDKKYAIHNTSYWKGIHYLGVGPSAHSFNGHSRSWNISNNFKYTRDVTIGGPYFEIENLSISNRVNECIMTSLRTMWGLNLEILEKQFGVSIRREIEDSLNEYVDSDHYEIKNNIIYLTQAGKLLADGIASNLFIEEVEL